MQVSDFQTITYEADKQIVFVRVNERSVSATTGLVKEAQYTILEALEQYKPIFLLINLVELHFPITPELQEWLNQEILPRLFGSGVKRIAYIMPTEFIEKLSIEQVYDEVATAIEQTEATTQVNYFDNEAEGLRWFNQKTNTLYKFA